MAAFLHGLGGSTSVVAIGLALTLVFSFFFTSVAANAIATTARNPVSGMTMLTVIVSSVVPPQDFPIRAACRDAFGIDPLFVALTRRH